MDGLLSDVLADAPRSTSTVRTPTRTPRPAGRQHTPVPAADSARRASAWSNLQQFDRVVLAQRLQDGVLSPMTPTVPRRTAANKRSRAKHTVSSDSSLHATINADASGSTQQQQSDSTRDTAQASHPAVAPAGVVVADDDGTYALDSEQRRPVKRGRPSRQTLDSVAGACPRLVPVSQIADSAVDGARQTTAASTPARRSKPRGRGRTTQQGAELHGAAIGHGVQATQLTPHQLSSGETGVRAVPSAAWRRTEDADPQHTGGADDAGGSRQLHARSQTTAARAEPGSKRRRVAAPSLATDRRMDIVVMGSNSANMRRLTARQVLRLASDSMRDGWDPLNNDVRGFGSTLCAGAMLRLASQPARSQRRVTSKSVADASPVIPQNRVAADREPTELPQRV